MSRLRKALKAGRSATRGAVLAANLTGAAWLVASAYGGMVDPARTAVGALVAMTLPFALAANVLLLVANLVVYRRMALVNAGAFALCLGPLYTFSPLNVPRERPAPDDPDALTLVSYNIYDLLYYNDTYHPDSLHRSLGYLLRRDPDVVVLQEANNLDPLVRWRYHRQQFDSVMRRWPYRIVNPFGLAVLSKFPVDTLPLDRRGYEASPSCDMVCYRLNARGRLLYLFNTHLQSIGLTPDDKALYGRLTRGGLTRASLDTVHTVLLGKLAHAYRLRAAQAHTLRRNIDSVVRPLSGRPVIVCGDFNDIPGSYSTRVVRGADMTDAFAHAGRGPSITYYANRFYFRIDHIFYRGDIDAVDVRRGDVRSSDHIPLEATFKFTD